MSSGGRDDASGPGPRPGPGAAARILVIDDERGIRTLCRDVLARAGHQVELADTAAAGRLAVAAQPFDLVLCDIGLPDLDGVSLLPSLLAAPAGGPSPAVILITAYPSIDTAVRGLKLGARDYVAKPFSPDELRHVVGRALDEDRLRRAHRALQGQLAGAPLVGSSPAMDELRRTLDRAAASDATVLITGESGTGKELVARALHGASPRSAGPFVVVDGAALSRTLADSELFGHVRGAFTGADTAKRGLLRAADHGTIFLDEIGELPLPAQPKLLRALADGEVKPVGAHQAIQVDLRVIAGTNRDLQAEIGAGRFREDLFFRLAVVTLEVPPLRARRGDVPVLARHFADQAALRAGRGGVELAADAVAALERHTWPGNVRELENVIERAVILTSADVITAADLQLGIGPRAASADPEGLPTLDDLERGHIERVLAACDGQKTRAAAILGINRTTLWKKLRQYGLG